MIRLLVAALTAITLLGAAPPTPLDSQFVLQRYAAKLLRAEEPKVLIFTYTVSQAGPYDIEQTHRVYRSGELVRDETLMVDGVRSKATRIARYRNRYTLDNLAPRMTQYAFLFQRAVRSGSSLSYEYQAVPLSPQGAFAIDGMTIDGRSFLPSILRFHVAGVRKASGTITFGRSGKYWVPVSAGVQARIGGKPAREHIAFTSYQFPASLPKSTFQAPKPLPTPQLPTF
jgi:hypothetical protein